jgi:hypothetical protein
MNSRKLYKIEPLNPRQLLRNVKPYNLIHTATHRSPVQGVLPKIMVSEVKSDSEQARDNLILVT